MGKCLPFEDKGLQESGEKMLNVNDVNQIYLGCQGENLARTIVIDVKPWLVAHPQGVVSLYHKRNGSQEATPTAAVFDAEAGTLTWQPTSTDTYVFGEGEAEIRLAEGSVIKKSRKIKTDVAKAVTGGDGTDLVSGWQGFLDAIEKAAQVAITKNGMIKFAVNSVGHLIFSYTDQVPVPADENDTSTTVGEITWINKDLGTVSAFGTARENGWEGTEALWTALQAACPELALKAESFGAGTRNGTPVTEDDPAYHNNAEYYAGQAAGSATAAGQSATAAAGSATAAAASAADALEHTQSTIHTWLENNIDPDSGYALDRTLTEPLAAAPADMVGDLKNDLNTSKDISFAGLYKDGGYVANIRDGTINSSNKYTGFGTTKHVLIPVSSGDSVSIKANDSKTAIYAILTKIDIPVNNGAASLSAIEGFTTRKSLTNGTAVTFTVPEDGHYLYLAYSVTSSGTVSTIIPSEITINGADMLQSLLQKLKDLAQTEADDRTMLSDRIDGLIDRTTITTDNIFTLDKAEKGMIDSSGKVIPSTTYPNVRTTNFIQAEASTKYRSSTKGTESISYRFTVVAFYAIDKSFISRVTNESEFTTPSNTAYIRMTENTNVIFPKKIAVSKYGNIQYKQNRIFPIDVLGTDKFYDLAMRTGNLEMILDDISIPLLIHNSNVWQIASDNPVFAGSHILLPIKEGDNIELTAVNNNAVYALLKTHTCFTGDSPDFVYQYEITQEEGYAPEFELITDGQGNPILDTRHIITKSQTHSFYAVPDTKYLYLSFYTLINGEQINILPQIKINGVDIYKIKTEENVSDEKKYETVFFDDFDTFNTDVWERVIADAPEPETEIVSGSQVYKQGWGYNSRFYTTEENAYVDQSCLVLKCSKGESGDNGYHTDVDRNKLPNEYLASYVSTGKSYVIPEGRISARIKMESPYGHNCFPACFWTFGQNAEWPYAHEMDIFEVIQFYLNEARTIKGTAYNKGSVGSTVSSHNHSRNSLVEDINTVRYIGIKYANNNNGIIQDDNEAYSVNILDNEWHTYTADFDEKQIRMLIDDVLFLTIDAEKVGATDMQGNTGFHYPQDIRFNIKAKATDADEGYMYIDWVKAEVVNNTPCTSISHENVSVAVNGTKYINPTFNEGCSNKAFSMETESEGIIEIYETTVKTANVVHIIKGVSAGTATVKLKSANGRTESTCTVTVS